MGHAWRVIAVLILALLFLGPRASKPTKYPALC
jgi:hypothetical protein